MEASNKTSSLNSLQVSFLSSLLVLFFSGNLFAASSFDDSFKKASTSGQLRFGYISVAPEGAGSATTGAAVAGEIKFETENWYRLQFAIAPYFVEKVDALSGDATSNKLNTDFLDVNGQSFAYLGEAYVNYAFSNGAVRLGRQKLDNPFINTDDIRMFSNTFNATWLNINLSKSLTLEAGQVSSWAGFDSGASQEKFKKASNNGAATAVGLNYSHSDALSAQAWYYSFNKNFSLLYADVTYNKDALELGAQFGSYTELSGSNIAGSVFGISASYTAGPLVVGAVFNSGANATSKTIDLGLGGGGYYAAMDETTIGGLNDAKAHVLSAEYAVSDKFSAAVALGHFEDNGKATNIDETDLILGYSASDTLNIEFIHTVVEDKVTSANGFSRQTARATYSF